MSAQFSVLVGCLLNGHAGTVGEISLVRVKLGSSMRIRTIALVVCLAVASSESSAKAKGVSLRGLYNYKVRLQRQFEYARSEFQKGLHEQKEILQSHITVLDKQTAIVESQSQMLTQQGKLIEQQIKLSDQQNRIIDKQSTVLDKSVERINLVGSLILVLGLLLAWITLRIGRSVNKVRREIAGTVEMPTVTDASTQQTSYASEAAPVAAIRRSGGWLKAIRALYDGSKSHKPAMLNPIASREMDREQILTDISQANVDEVYQRLIRELDSGRSADLSQAFSMVFGGEKKTAEDWMALAEAPGTGPIEQASAIFNAALLAEGNHAIKYYDEILNRFEHSDDLYLQEWVAKALINKSATLGKLGRHDEGLQVIDALVSRFGASVEVSLQERVAKALLNKGVTFDVLGRHEDAINVYRDVVGRFSDSTELNLRERVARALVYIGDSLDSLGQHEEATQAYDEVINRFATMTDPYLMERVAIAINNKGCCLIKWARLQWADKEWRMRRLKEAKACFAEAMKNVSADVSMVTANHAYVVMLLGTGELTPKPAEPQFVRGAEPEAETV